ncbi:tetratricopeptide repeat protein [Flavobacterium okayamense]|nr:hypothetical protein [Flavobacterium okayamense]
MLKKIIILSLITMISQAQTILEHNKRSVDCEDKWVTFEPDKSGKYLLGFIYIDSEAGLTFNYEGEFKIDDEGVFKRIDNIDSIKTNSLKARLRPDIKGIAEIPKNKFKELNIDETPKWLKFYKEGENSIERLFKWGYMYNGWNECEKALTFLLKAEKIDSNFEGLQTEIAFSYNALKEFKKAETALLKAIKNDPKDCYTLKELAYTYRHMDELKKSAEIYHKMESCDNIVYIQETAYNLAYRYYELKDNKNFSKWSAEVLKWGDKKSIYSKNIEILKNELKD